jgi:hypothetical protein
MSALVVAAGVAAAAAPVVAMPGPDLPAISSAAVRPASVVTDALINFGTAVETATYAVSLPVDLVVSLPFDTLYAAASALRDPAAVGSLLSWLAQRYVNPGDLYTYSGGLKIYTYPWDFKVSVLEPIANGLPAPLSEAAIGALNDVADAINDVLSALPDSTAGDDATWAFMNDNLIGSTLHAAQLGILAPVYALAYVVSWVGYLPADLAGTVEAAIANPADVPGLLSNLAYNVLDLGEMREAGSLGLLGGLVNPIVNAGSWLPAPLGVSAGDNGLFLNAYAGLHDAVSNLLSMLPDPVSPFGSVPEVDELQTVAPVEPDTVLASASAAADVPALTQAAPGPELSDAHAAESVAAQPVSELAQVSENPVDEPGDAQPSAPASPDPQPQAGPDAAPAAPAADGQPDADGSEAAGQAVTGKDEPAKRWTKRGHVKSHNSAGSSAKSDQGKGDASKGASDSAADSGGAKSDGGGSADAGSSQDAA